MRWNTVSVGCGAKFRRLIQSDWARGSLPDVTARDLGTSTISYHWLNSSRWQDLESLFPPFRPHLRDNHTIPILHEINTPHHRFAPSIEENSKHSIPDFLAVDEIRVANIIRRVVSNSLLPEETTEGVGLDTNRIVNLNLSFKNRREGGCDARVEKRILFLRPSLNRLVDICAVSIDELKTSQMEVYLVRLFLRKTAFLSGWLRCIKMSNESPPVSQLVSGVSEASTSRDRGGPASRKIRLMARWRLSCSMITPFRFSLFASNLPFSPISCVVWLLRFTFIHFIKFTYSED
ncbi:hypothetical protein NPIL_10161 [Nephila pilipes]|uniref:Uncharacterized protein n=1 Tax=Nephila pilipes TaxID=299642 RepID=A0A8X6PXE3_NEPPI|nr:hypothetical protein NPIL_10161 [Nephila pilipes]